jgi:hypothetical protein
MNRLVGASLLAIGRFTFAFERSASRDREQARSYIVC